MTRDPNAAARAQWREIVETRGALDWDTFQWMRYAAEPLLDELDACRRWIGRQTRDRPFCYRCEVLDAAGAGNCRCEIAANE